MRVLYVGRGFGVHDRRFVAAFAAQPPTGPGWQVGCVALDKRPRLKLPAGVVWAEAQPDRNDHERRQLPDASERVREAARRFRPDVLVAGPLQDATLAAVRAATVPVVAISWAFDLLVDATDLDGRRAATEALGGAASLLCDAHAVARAAVALGMAADRITMAPWGVDLGRFAPHTDRQARSELGWRDAFVIVSTRNHEPLYGLETVIDACQRAAPSVPSLRLLMLADGSLRAALEDRARAAGLGKAVHFTGQADSAALPGWYAAADLYVSASPVDGSSVSLMEALACGLPAAVADIAGNREWVEPGANGWLFPVGDAGALAAAITEAARMAPAARARMSRSARAVAELRADWTRNARCITQAIAAVVPDARGLGRELDGRHRG